MGRVRGTVTDRTSSVPIAGALVRLEPRSYWGDALPWVYEVTSDAAGTFETPAIPSSYGVEVSHPAYASFAGSLTVGSGGDTWLNVSLGAAGARAANLRGYVSETGTGAPISAGRIVAEPSYALSGSYRNESALNASGYYEMALVAGTYYDIGTRGVAGYAPYWYTFEYVSSGIQWFNFTLDPNPVDAWVNGTVRSDADSSPIPNATVSALVDGEPFGPVLSDASGAFSLSVPSGDVTIAADAIRFQYALTSAYVWSGSTAYVTLYLQPLSATIRGYVTNATSRLPVGGAAVTASDFDLFYERVVTDASGYYEIHAVPDLLDVRATADGYGSTRTFAFLSEGQTLWWNITLYPIIADVVGYAVDAADGSHLPNMTVLVADAITGYYNYTSTDASGFFRARMTAVPFVIATVAGTGGYAGGFAYGNAARGGTVWVNVTVQRVSATVRVNVTDGLSGGPVPDVTVSLSWLGLFADWGATDANGSILLDAPAARTITIFATKSGYDFAYTIVDLVPGANFVDLVVYRDLPYDVTLRGYVTNETGAPISSARVDATGYGDQDAWEYTDSSGYYNMQIVAAPQRVLATYSGRTGNGTTVSPSPGETVWANFTLRADPDRPIFLSLRAIPNAGVSPANPTDLVAELLEASPDWASGSLYRMVARAGNVGTFVQVRSLAPEDFEILPRGPDRYDVTAPWDARATGGWIRDATQSEWWPVSTMIQPGSYAIMGSWTNGTATADPAVAGFDQFTGRLQFVFSATYGIVTAEMDPLSTFRPSALATRYDLVTGAQSFEPPVRGSAFRLGSVRLDYSDLVPSGTYAASVGVYDHAGRWNSSVTFFGVDTGIDGTPPSAAAGPDVSTDEDLPVAFDGTASSDDVGIVNWTWTFSDGSVRTLYGSTASYAFATPGTYVVTLAVRDSAGNVGTDTFTVTVSDVTPPTVSITSPAAGATASGTIAVVADATDNGGAVRVEFFVDDVSVGNDTAAPYSFSLDTTGYADGNHVVRVVAYDAAGYTAEATRTVYVSNSGPVGDPGFGGLVAVGGIGLFMAIVVAAAVLFLLRGRRPRSPDATAPPDPAQPEQPAADAPPEAPAEPAPSEESVDPFEEL
jgi:hypothetical protein